MFHIQTMIDTHRSMCLEKFIEDFVSLERWKILSFFLNNYGHRVKFLLHRNFSVADLLNCLPNFYMECF